MYAFENLAGIAPALLHREGPIPAIAKSPTLMLIPAERAPKLAAYFDSQRVLEVMPLQQTPKSRDEWRAFVSQPYGDKKPQRAV